MFGIKKLRKELNNTVDAINTAYLLTTKDISKNVESIEAIQHKISILDTAVHSPFEKIDNYLAVKFEKLEELIDAVHMNLIRELLRRDIATEQYIDAHLMKYKGYEIKKIVKEVFLEKPGTLSFQDIKNRLFKDILKTINSEIDKKVEEIRPKGSQIPEDANPAHYCLGCTTYIGHRGFCSAKCHDIWYDTYSNPDKMRGNKDEGQGIHEPTSKEYDSKGIAKGSEDKSQAEPKSA